MGFPAAEESRKALTVLLERFTTGRPRKPVASVPCKPHLLFTDGALEYDEFGNPNASTGSVLMIGTEKCLALVGVAEQLLKLWCVSSRIYVIGLVEYAAVIGLHTWRETFKNDRVIIFLACL